jgi:rubredoxin
MTAFGYCKECLWEKQRKRGIGGGRRKRQGNRVVEVGQGALSWHFHRGTWICPECAKKRQYFLPFLKDLFGQIGLKRKQM